MIIQMISIIIALFSALIVGIFCGALLMLINSILIHNGRIPKKLISSCIMLVIFIGVTIFVSIGTLTAIN